MKSKSEKTLNEVLNYIRCFVEENNGTSPKFKDIVNFMGASESVAYRYLLALRDRGLVEYNGKGTLRVKNQEKYKANYKRIAILGTIACGTPEDYRQDIQGYVAIPCEWIDGECYLLRASGDSMIDVGIDDGDLVLIKIANEAYNGQIVAALTDDGTTLKRYVYSGGRAYLHAENKTYKKKNIYPRELMVQGIALKIIKDLR
ncbi:MAG: repressor LexA [Clostridia bacterium]|nr:repressor LexA [Clostridia bacterium]